MKRPREVIVSWHDAYQSHGQHTMEELPEDLLLVRTRGLLVKETDTKLIIAGEDLPLEDPVSYRAVTVIPKALVVSVDEVPQRRKPRPGGAAPASSPSNTP